MNHTEIERRVHELLDALRDPLADHDVAAHLAEHPSALDAFARLHERLAALPAAVAQPIRRARWPWLAAAAAALAFAGLASWLGAGAEAATAARGRVLAASFTPIEPTVVPPTVTARAVLLAVPGARFETFVHWSPR